LCLLFLTGLLENLPKAALADVMLRAVYGLLDFTALARMWGVSCDFYACHTTHQSGKKNWQQQSAGKLDFTALTRLSRQKLEVSVMVAPPAISAADPG
jgi:hypothetical protein